jgi:hypothetical protein
MKSEDVSGHYVRVYSSNRLFSRPRPGPGSADKFLIRIFSCRELEGASGSETRRLRLGESLGERERERTSE